MREAGPQLGFCPEVRNYLRVSTKAKTHHILLTGKSGSGKTIATIKISKHLVQEGQGVILFNIAGAYDFIRNDRLVKCIDILRDGFPFPFLQPLIRPDQGKESTEDVVEAGLEMFQSVARMSVSQKNTLRRALEKAVKNISPEENEFLMIKRILQEKKTNANLEVLDKFYSLFARVHSGPVRTVFEPGKITMFDLSKFPRSVQFAVAEMLLAYIWRCFQVYGQSSEKSLYLVLDEFHNFHYREGSTIAQLLREGRKFRLSLILATQTLQSFDKADKAILSQTGTRLCFQPDSGDFKEIVRTAEPEDKERIWGILCSLKSGECLAMGDFECHGYDFSKNVQMTFREDSILL